MAVIKNVAIILVFCPSILLASPFHSLIEKIKGRDPRILAQQEQLNSARTTRIAAKTNFLPSFDMEVARSKSSLTNLETDTVNVNAGLNLWSSGRDWGNLKYTGYNLEAQESKLQAVGLEVEREASTVIFQVIYLAKQREILAKLVGLREQSLKVAEVRYQRGLTPESELLKAKVELSNSKARLKDGEIQLEEALAKIENLSSERSTFEQWPWPLEKVAIAVEFLGKRNLAVQSRPDYRAQLNIYMAEEENSKISRSSLFPKLDLKVGRGLTESLNGNSWETTTTIMLTIPIFSGLTDYAFWKKQKATQEGARQALIGIERNADSQVKKARETLRLALLTAKERLDVLEVSRALYADNFRRYQSGHTSYNDLAQDQERLLQSELLAGQGMQQVHIGLSELCYQTGMMLLSCMND